VLKYARSGYGAMGLVIYCCRMSHGHKSKKENIWKSVLEQYDTLTGK